MSFAPKKRKYFPPFSAMAGAHMARLAQETALVSRTWLCFVQCTRSGDEKASRNTCSPYRADHVGKIQYSVPKIAPSGSAYQPDRTGLPDMIGLRASGAGEGLAQPEITLARMADTWATQRDFIIY